MLRHRLRLRGAVAGVVVVAECELLRAVRARRLLLAAASSHAPVAAPQRGRDHVIHRATESRGEDVDERDCTVHRVLLAAEELVRVIIRAALRRFRRRRLRRALIVIVVAELAFSNCRRRRAVIVVIEAEVLIAEPF